MRKGWLLTGVLSFAIAGFGITIGGAMAYGSEDTLPKGFSVAGLELGGVSASAALDLVHTRVVEWEAVSVAVEDAKGDRLKAPSLTLKALGMQIDVSEGVAELERLRDLGWWERAKARFQGEVGRSYEMKVHWDEDAFRTAANRTWQPLVTGQAKDATRTINAQDQVEYTPETLGRTLDVAGMLDQVKEFEPLTLAVDSQAEPHVATLTIFESYPEITVEKLKEEGIDRKIAEFTTSFTTSGAGRAHNVTAAAMALNDTLLQPDEVFDYGKIVELAEEKYGWKEAPVIMNGKLTPGIGGGICQVSSTLYNAALLSGLDIVERRNHSLAVHYLPAGLDATYAGGYVNFKFRNSTGKQLLIRAVVENKKLTIKLFGTLPENVTYKTETVELKVNPPKTVYVANEKLTLGKTSTVQKGEPGFVVESYRIKLVDGVAVERTKLSRDTYRSTDALVAVNPADERLNPADNGKPAPTPEHGPIEPV